MCNNHDYLMGACLCCKLSTFHVSFRQSSMPTCSVAHHTSPLDVSCIALVVNSDTTTLFKSTIPLLGKSKLHPAHAGRFLTSIRYFFLVACSDLREPVTLGEGTFERCGYHEYMKRKTSGLLTIVTRPVAEHLQNKWGSVPIKITLL